MGGRAGQAGMQHSTALHCTHSAHSQHATGPCTQPECMPTTPAPERNAAKDEREEASSQRVHIGRPPPAARGDSGSSTRGGGSISLPVADAHPAQQNWGGDPEAVSCASHGTCLPTRQTCGHLYCPAPHLYRAWGFIISGARKAGVPLQRSNSPSSPSTSTLLQTDVHGRRRV